jgi:hypothetical protein
MLHGRRRWFGALDGVTAMAVKMNKQARRFAVMALAISAFTLPSVASADPSDGGRGGWRGRSEEGGRPARTENRDNGGDRGGDRGRQEQARAVPAPQAAPQAQSNWSGRSDRGDRGASQGGERHSWNGGAAPQTAPQQQPVQQAGWSGGNREGRGQDRQAQDRTRTRDRDGNRDGQARSWTDGNRENRDGDRRQRDTSRTRDRNGGYVQGGTYYGSSGSTANRDGRSWDRNHDRNGDRDHHQWNRQWRSNSSYNWYSYRSSHPSYFRLGSYYSPYRNYSYRRLSIGFFLDNLFFGQDYLIDNPGYYRLPDVYGPYRWVRYYDDAVLVDIYSGEVVDVIYDFFW